MAQARSGEIVNVMKEERLFPPSSEFSARARIGSLEQYEKLWNEAAQDIEGAVCQVVRRRPDKRFLQLPGHSPGYAAAKQSGVRLGGGAG